MLKDNGRRSLSMILVVGIIGMLCLTACSEGKKAEADLSDAIVATQPSNYKTTKVQLGDYVETAVGSASVTYVGWGNLSWESDNAYYQEVKVKARQTVKKGDPLIIFRIEGNEVELEELKLQLRRQNENYAKGKEERQAAIDREKNNAETLGSYEQQIALLTVEKLQAEYDRFVYQTEKVIAQLETRITAIEQEKEKNTLVAPFDGIVNWVADYNVGDKVVAGQILIKIIPTEKMLINARKATEVLRYNMPVTVETNSNKGTAYTGRVVVAPNILPGNVSQAAVLIELDEQVDRRNLTGTLKINSVPKEVCNVLVVDRDAINDKDDETYVNVLEGDTVKKRYVVVKTNTTETAWVLDGLSEGQTLIIE